MPTLIETMVVEHSVFLKLFDEIERRLPAMGTVAEVKLAAELIEGLLAAHGQSEEDLAYAALDHMLAERGRMDTLYQDHVELDGRLEQLKSTQDVKEARQHFRRKELTIFPLIEAALQKNMLKELGDAWIHAEQIPVRQSTATRSAA